MGGIHVYERESRAKVQAEYGGDNQWYTYDGSIAENQYYIWTEAGSRGKIWKLYISNGYSKKTDK